MLIKIIQIGLIFELVSAQLTWPNDTYAPGVCICVPVGQCSIASGGGNADGRGNLDARIAISGGMPSIITGTINNTCQPVSVGVQISALNQTSCATADLELCCPTSGFTCGIRYPPVASASTPVSGSGQSLYGNHPWIIAIFNLTYAYVGTGVLISQQHALTVAHKLVNQTSPLIVRMGEYDLNGAKLPLPRVELNATFVMHPSFVQKNLRNDIAVLILASPAPLGKYPTITNMCIPNVTLSGIRCWIAGWGIDFFTGGNKANILREIDVPLIDSDTCQMLLRNNTELGSLFGLDKYSFVCAGGEAGKDACTGDGGAPLSCFAYDRWYLMGLTSWGMGCGQAGVPGVYTNVQSYVSWIQSTIQSPSKGLNTTTVKPPQKLGSVISTSSGGSSSLSTTFSQVSTTLGSTSSGSTVVQGSTGTSGSSSSNSSGSTTLGLTISQGSTATSASTLTVSQGSNGSSTLSVSQGSITISGSTSTSSSASQGSPATSGSSTSVKPKAKASGSHSSKNKTKAEGHKGTRATRTITTTLM